MTSTNVYLDASSWNRLAERGDRADLIPRLAGRHLTFFASVISSTELLRTPEPTKRRLLCETMMSLVARDFPILEDPLALAFWAADSWLRNEPDFRIREMEDTPGSALTALSVLDYLHNPDSANEETLERFDGEMRRKKDQFEEVIVSLRGEIPGSAPTFEALWSDARFLTESAAFSPLGLTTERVQRLGSEVGIWRAFLRAISYAVEMGVTHAPKRTARGRRPGGPDFWQAVYLGTVHVFVVDDGGFRDALGRIAAAAGFPVPRTIVSLEEFLALA